MASSLLFARVEEAIMELQLYGAIQLTERYFEFHEGGKKSTTTFATQVDVTLQVDRTDQQPL